jgi:uncharacterized protein (DUF608 family)
MIEYIKKILKQKIKVHTDKLNEEIRNYEKIEKNKMGAFHSLDIMFEHNYLINFYSEMITKSSAEQMLGFIVMSLSDLPEHKKTNYIKHKILEIYNTLELNYD